MDQAKRSLNDYLYGESHGHYSETTEGLRAISLSDFMSIEWPEREPLLGPWLLKRSINMIYAARGLGKTQLAMSIALAVAKGEACLHWQAAHPAKVLYLDGEMPADQMRERFTRLSGGALTDRVVIANPDAMMEGKMLPDIATEVGRNDVEELIDSERPDLVVIDNLSSFARGTRENEGDSWAPIQEWLIHLRTMGYAILLIHHAGKNGQQRGSSRKEDVMDVVIQLKHPDDYVSSESGARFELYFDKHRHLFGKDVQPMDVALEAGEHGQLHWTTQVVGSPKQQAIELAKDGVAVSEIAETLNRNKGTISKWLKSARNDGLLPNE